MAGSGVGISACVRPLREESGILVGSARDYYL